MEYMEAVLTSIGLLKDMWSSISKCFNYHKIVDKNCRILEEKMERLKCREQDVNVELQNAQFHRKKEKKEVENWLKEVQNLKDDVERMEQEVGKGRCFSRLGFLRQSEENIEKVDELLELGKFPEGILIDVHQNEGKALLTTQLIGETTAKRNLEKIWTCLEMGEIQSIGVWGMGGIGKTTIVTHIHNRLLEKDDTFGLVFWVTVSKESSIHKLQDAIAGKINLDFSKKEDEMTRSALLFEALQKKKKFVLILDDVWEVYAPREVGIPIGVDGGKLIITTRSRDVCLRMGCKEIIKLEALSQEEASELFNKTLERYNVLNQKEEEIAKNIIKECAGLPLAIVTTARSMSVVYDIAEWRNALNELREHVKGHTIDMENDVFKILEFSYNRLNNEKIRECLLYCALFPEDHEIRRVSLIKYWIAEGLLEEMRTRQAKRDRGHAILNKLENVCLLERCQNGKCVKMHDVIRDMAINITRSRFMVKTERYLEDLPSEMEWSNNVERVSLMDSQLSTLMFVPNCPKLSTLFLQKHKFANPFRCGLHEGLPDSFFVHMVGLRVLDLSHTDIAFLPNSIYGMVNLRALILCYCRKLKHVGSLAKLKELRELDLSWNEMETIPDGIEKLILLKHFSWIAYPLSQALPNPTPNPLPNLLHLQCLRLEDRRFMDVGAEELSGLRKLEILSVNFSSLHNFNSYIRTQHYWRLTHYHVQLNGRKSIFPRFQPNPHDFCKGVEVWECKLKEEGKDDDDYQLMLPTNIQFLQINRCHLPTSLIDVSPSLKIATDLKACLIIECKGIEYLWWVEGCIASLNTLYLHELPSLRDLFMFRPTATVSCSSLKHLNVSDCNNLKHMFTLELVKYHIQNLQTIYVSSCNQMEDIIVAAAEVEEEEEEEGEEDTNETNNLILCLPNLQSFELAHVPKLKSIWKGTMTCDSLQRFTVMYCPKLRRLPLSVHINDGDGEGRPSTPPLKQIKGEQMWWDGVEWDTHPHAKSVFQPLFVQDASSMVSIIFYFA